ncbi:hypothetical protein V9T40_010021 [Parthenolecanium corni]|uniref:CUB domain-containing protein n=1 Tax=Parthenolecanium corni TaxID=536013 RepID=A0AAN9TJB7_9HEMI
MVDSPLIGLYSGHALPEVLSAGNKLFVKFYSDSSNVYPGFRAVYTTEVEPISSSSDWSPWTSCNKADSLNGTDQCLCSMRQCNNLALKNVTVNCQGPSMKVTNCTIHGGWTEWSKWSSCNSTCGKDSVKIRNRTCSNPTPVFGGRDCAGQEREMAFCTENPPWGWSPWSPWKPCKTFDSQNEIIECVCHSRTCDNPIPQNGGAECEGAEGEAMIEKLVRRPAAGNTKVLSILLNSLKSHSSKQLIIILTDNNPDDSISTTQILPFIDASKTRIIFLLDLSRKKPNTVPAYNDITIACGGLISTFDTTEGDDYTKVNLPKKKFNPVLAFNEIAIASGGSLVTFDPSEGDDYSNVMFILTRNLCNPLSKEYYQIAVTTNGLIVEVELDEISYVTVEPISSWSNWSSWTPCNKVDSLNGTDQCLCSMRQCYELAPQNITDYCQGPSMKITNCTIHGEWTEWSKWSSCNSTCGKDSVKIRNRTCSNPTPAFGGRDCAGQEREMAFCTENPPCPTSDTDVINTFIVKLDDPSQLKSLSFAKIILADGTEGESFKLTPVQNNTTSGIYYGSFKPIHPRFHLQINGETTDGEIFQQITPVALAGE